MTNRAAVASPTETAKGETIETKVRLSFAWDVPASYQPSREALSQLSREISSVVPGDLLHAWGQGKAAPILVDAEGKKDAATLREYARARLAELKAKRPASADALELTGGNQAAPKQIKYVYVGGELVAVSLFPLNLSQRAWTPTNIAGAPAASIALQLQWKMP